MDQNAYNDGYRAGRLDRQLSWCSDYALHGVDAYSVGYRDGVNGRRNLFSALGANRSSK